MTARNAPSLLPENVDENTVRRLCGAEVFVLADTYQRDGHVLGPTLGEHGPEASVRGTFRRVDQIAIHVTAGRLQPHCARHGAEFCQHVGALLLQCLRDPDSIASPVPVDADDSGSSYLSPLTSQPAQPTIESPAAELARLLDLDTANHLREIARRRGVRLSGTKKAAIVQQLATSLTDSANIDAAIAELDDAERSALDAIHLMGVETSVTLDVAREGMRVLGGNGQPPIDALLDRGLIVLPHRQSYVTQGYLVPRVIAARLPTLDQLAEPASARRTPETGTQLGIIEMIQVMAQAVLADDIRLKPQGISSAIVGNVPHGFVVDPVDVRSGVVTLDRSRKEGIRLLPQRLLADMDLRRLSGRMGQPVEAVDFVARLMVDFQLIEMARDRMVIRFDRLKKLLDMPPSERLARLANVWLHAAGPYGYDALFGPAGALQARWNPSHAMWAPPIHVTVVSAANLVARLVSRMTPGKTYGLASFAGMVDRLVPSAAPRLMQLHTMHPNMQPFTVASLNRRGERERLALGTLDGWSRYIAVLVSALVSGPLAWLGLVDVAVDKGTASSFRVRVDAGVLRDREVPRAAERPHRLIVADDLTVTVPPQTTDTTLHGFLSHAGELVDASAKGLRYRLTPSGVQAVFDAGTTGPELIELLASRAGGSIPAAVEAELDRWWQRYGTIRIYDELSVVELSDDFLLAELTGTTSLKSAIVQVFSPRLIAIDGARIDVVIDELIQRGYAPRVFEAS